MAFLAPFLFGTAATGTAAATAGLFGTGGAFSLGTTLGTLGTAAAVGGAISQATAARAEGQANAAAANFNAQQSALEAQSRETAQRAESSRRLATIRSQIGKSGATSAGTPLLVLSESAANAEIDALNTRYTGMREQGVYRASAANSLRQGRTAAGTALLSGFGRVF